MYKTQWIELGFDWDDDRIYPSNSDSSLTEGSDEAPPADTAPAEAADALVSPSWTVGALCMAKYAADDNFYPAEVVKIAPDGVKVSFTDYDNEHQVCAEKDLRAFDKAKSIQAGPVSIKEDPNDAPFYHEQGCKPGLSSLLASTTASGSPSENVTCDELEQVSSSDRELAKTISHHINMLYRNVGKKEPLLSTLLRSAAKEEHCAVLLRWLNPKPAVINVQHSQPIIIGDDDNDDDNEAEQEQQRRRVSVPRNASKRARELGKPKQVGWADEDLKK